MMKEYIGDGLYADYDGRYIIVTSEDGISVLDKIYLEEMTYSNLVNYVNKFKDKE